MPSNEAARTEPPGRELYEVAKAFDYFGMTFAAGTIIDRSMLPDGCLHRFLLGRNLRILGWPCGGGGIKETYWHPSVSINRLHTASNVSATVDAKPAPVKTDIMSDSQPDLLAIQTAAWQQPVRRQTLRVPEPDRGAAQ